MITQDFGLVNAKFIPDQWHLLKAVKDYLRPHLYDKVAPFLKGMVDAKTESEFKCSADTFMVTLTQNKATADQLSYADENLIKKRTRWLYVQYELDKIPGSFGRHGSSASEQNHSSIMKRLGKGYCAHPTREQRDLMDRTSARIEGKTLNIKRFNIFEVEQQKYVYFLREEWGSNGGFKV